MRALAHKRRIMKALSLKNKTIISVVVFLVVLAILIALASVFDFQISEILTENTLPNGDYHAAETDFFGTVGEIIGCTPLYLFALFAVCVLFWSALKLWDKKPYNIIVAIALFGGGIAASFFIYKDAVSYMIDHIQKLVGYGALTEPLYEFYHRPAIVAVEVLLGALTTTLAILASKNFKPETLKKLLKLVVAGAIAVVVANVLVLIIKTPVGRMRFRAINSELGQGLVASGEAGYTPWYILNKQPNEGILNGFKNAYGVEDAFKSFPSGHTCTAATTYVLLMVPSLFNFKEKKNYLGIALCWLVPIIYTGLVALSRIVIGAHYMSDVTFGGTFAFACVMICKEIFIDKGAHFFALFPTARKKAVVAEEVEIEAYQADENTDEQKVDDVANEAVEQESTEELAFETSQEDAVEETQATTEE